MATIQKRKDSYKITVSCGYDLTGKQIRKTTTWTPDHGMTAKQIEKELERQKVLFEERCRSGQVLEGSIKFADFAEKWFQDYAQKQLRAETLAGYRTFMKRINAAIGHIKLDRLQPHHLLSFYSNLQEIGIREDTKYKCKIDLKSYLKTQKLTKKKVTQLCNISMTTLDSICKGNNVNESSAKVLCSALSLDLYNTFEVLNKDVGLSAKTIQHYHSLISSILSTAVQWQVIASNPCTRVRPPKLEKKNARYLNEVQAAHLLELLETENMQYKTMIKLLLYTGFRRGELCGLEWDDIDFNNCVIHVRRSSNYVPDKGIFVDETKNATSIRCIKVPTIAFEMLQDYRRWQIEERLKVGDQWQDNNRLFTTWNGKPIHPDSITGWFHNFIIKTDLPYITVHSLRHTNATLQIAGGVPLSTISDRLGHADTATTGRIYVHAIRSADEAAAETLENLLNPVNKIQNMA